MTASRTGQPVGEVSSQWNTWSSGAPQIDLDHSKGLPEQTASDGRCVLSNAGASPRYVNMGGDPTTEDSSPGRRWGGTDHNFLYGQVTIPSPSPVMEYERTLETLQPLWNWGARLKQDCRVDELEAASPILKRLEKVGANLVRAGLPGPAAG